MAESLVAILCSLLHDLIDDNGRLHSVLQPSLDALKALHPEAHGKVLAQRKQSRDTRQYELHAQVAGSAAERKRQLEEQLAAIQTELAQHARIPEGI